jgi:hypothetical protein
MNNSPPLSKLPKPKRKATKAKRKTKAKVSKPKTLKVKIPKAPPVIPMDSTTITHYPNMIIYHEGGDSFRPIISIELPHGSNELPHGSNELPRGLWVTPNILYYRSSSRSNDRTNTLSTRNVWFPIAGMVDVSMENMKGRENFNYGHLIKMSDIYKLDIRFSYEWIYELLYDYFLLESNTNNTDFYYINPLQLDRNNYNQLKMAQINLMNRNFKNNIHESFHLSERFIQIHTIFHDYFIYDWQLYISAILGGGFWDENIDLRNLRTIILDKYSSRYNNIPQLPDISFIPLYNKDDVNDNIFNAIYTISDEKPNQKDVIDFSIGNNCQIPENVIEDPQHTLPKIPEKNPYFAFYIHQTFKQQITNYEKWLKRQKPVK